MRTRIYIAILIIASGCSASTHLKLAKRHLKKAEIKGAIITPDTVYKLIPFRIPGDSGKTNAVELVTDTTKLNEALNAYDSLRDVIESRPTNEQLIQANKEIKRLKNRIGKGFAKDTVYNIPVDSLTTLHLLFKNNLLDSVGYSRKPQTINQSVPVAVDQEIKAPPAKVRWWHWLCIGFVLGIIAALFLRV